MAIVRVQRAVSQGAAPFTPSTPPPPPPPTPLSIYIYITSHTKSLPREESTEAVQMDECSN